MNKPVIAGMATLGSFELLERKHGQKLMYHQYGRRSHNQAAKCNLSTNLPAAL